LHHGARLRQNAQFAPFAGQSTYSEPVRVRVTIALIVSALAVGGGAAASTHASLSIVSRQPIILHGQGFRPLELVRVTLVTRVTRIRTIRASSAGKFTLSYPGVNVPRCGGLFAHARGASGRDATLKIPLPACQPA
jgi:hypothetical protein